MISRENAPAAISAFVDTPFRFALHARTWLSSLNRLNFAGHFDIFLHLAPEVPAHVEDQLIQMGARVIRIPSTLMGANEYCNKISQLESGALAGYDKIILSDLDTFFLQNPFEFCDFTRVAGKIVDLANPPLEIFDKILAEAGLPRSYTPIPTLAGKDSASVPCNFNGGLYLIPGFLAETISQNWRKWADFCIKRDTLLGRYVIHADQIGFAMTVLDAQLPFQTLDVFHNFPSHLRAKTHEDGSPIYASIPAGIIKMIHYHQCFEFDGSLQLTGTGWVDNHIQQANQILQDFKSQLGDAGATAGSA